VPLPPGPRARAPPPPAPAPKEQERRQRQEQADLTEDIARQQEVERRQRLLAYQDVQREREAATRRANMEAQRMQQLSDLQAEAPRTPAAAAPAGNRGQEDDLRTRYVAALQQAADQNWNHLGAPELTACKVRFTQIRGGEVINVEFIACPYDVQGREFVERALRKGMMPYAGFESVFERQVSLTFCYPREDCQR
jgi:colicin import membrane protein